MSAAGHGAQASASGAGGAVSEQEIFKLRAAIREEEVKAERARMVAADAAVRREARRQQEWERAHTWAGEGVAGTTGGVTRAVIVVAALAVTALAALGIARLLGENAVDKTLASLGLTPGALTLEQQKHLEEKHRLLKLAHAKPLYETLDGIELKKEMIMKSRKFGLKVRSVVDEMGQKDFEAAREELKKKHQKAEARATPKGYDCPTRLFRYQCGFKTLDPVERDRQFRKGHECKAIFRNCEFDEDGSFVKRTYCGNLWPAPCEGDTERSHVGIARWLPRGIFFPRHTKNDERLAEMRVTPSPPPLPGYVTDEERKWALETPPPPIEALSWVRNQPLSTGVATVIPKANKYESAEIDAGRRRARQ
ncbi:hypothetical protein NFJ02_05g121160 [Pycnococcus provasolii]